MPFTPTPLADGQLAAAKGTLYTCPASTKAIVKSIILVNSDVAARTVNLYVKPGATSRRIIAKDTVLNAGAALEFDVVLTLDDGDQIEGDASSANVVDYVISGGELT